MKNELTFERASELLRYDPETGKLYWLVDAGRYGRIKAGTEAGTLSREGRNTYRRIKIDGQRCYAHCIAWLLHFGLWPSEQIDHLNGNGLDNRIKNLRDVTGRENQKNARMRRDNTSGHIGVCWDKLAGKWKAQICIVGKRKNLGLFADYTDACAAQKAAARANGYTERHGEVM